MTKEEMIRLFESREHYLSGEGHDFEAFQRLNALGLRPKCPYTKKPLDFIDAANHCFVFLAIDVDKLAEVATIEDIEYLAGCGVFYDEPFNSIGFNI